MKINSFFLSLAIVAFLMIDAYAGHPYSNLIVISDQNTTGVVLGKYDQLNVTSSGNIKIHNNANDAINSQSIYSILNDGIIDMSNTNQTIVGYTNGIQQANDMYYWADSSTPPGITNTGTINIINDATAYAIGIQQNTSAISSTMPYLDRIRNDINNSGTIYIQSQGNTHSTGIYQSTVNGDISGNIINSGTIIIDANQSSSATGITQVTDYGNITGNITNSGTINVLGGTAIYSDTSGNVINSGTISADLVNIGSANFTNSGMLNLHGNRSSSVKYFTQTSTGILNIDANIASGGTVQKPSISASTSATIANGSTINVNVIGSSTEIFSFLDKNGTINNIISSNQIDTNVTKLNITDNSPIINFQAFLNDTNTSLSLIAHEVVTPQNSPITALSTPTIGLQTLNMLNTIVQTRQNDTRGMGSGDIAFSDKHIWVKPFGVYTKQNDSNGLNGFSANTYGIGLGFDGEYKEGKRAGFAMFYSNSNLDVNHVDQSNDINTYNFVAYGSQPIIDDKSVLFYQAGFGMQKNSATRYDVSSSQYAKANYTSKDFYIQAKATKSYDINDNLRITPALKGVYRYFYSPAYIESGAGATNLSVDSKSITQVLFGAMTDLKYKIDENTNFISDIGFMYDIRDDSNSVNAIFQGSPNIIFTTTGIKNNALSYHLGFGIAKHLEKDLKLNLKYTLSGTGSNLINHALSAKFRWKF